MLRRNASVDWRRFAALVGIGAITALALAALLVPPILGDWNSVHAKSGQGYVDVDTVYRMVLILCGTGRPLPSRIATSTSGFDGRPVESGLAR